MLGYTYSKVTSYFLAFLSYSSELIQSEGESKSNYTDNFGRSLLGGLSQKYIPEMALHGVAELDVQDVMSELELSTQVRDQY